MSEKINNLNHEKHSSSEKDHGHEAKKHHERIKSKHEKEASAKHEHGKNIEKIRNTVETESVNKHEHPKVNQEAERSESNQPTLVNKELKDIAYKRTLKKTQAKLSPTSRSFSKVIHQPLVEKASEIAGNTIARPSGILFGGIFSFIGSSFFLWAARHYGYEYNFLLFLLFFIGGFIIGLIIEIMIWAIKTKK